VKDSAGIEKIREGVFQLALNNVKGRRSINGHHWTHNRKLSVYQVVVLLPYPFLLKDTLIDVLGPSCPLNTLASPLSIHIQKDCEVWRQDLGINVQQPLRIYEQALICK